MNPKGIDLEVYVTERTVQGKGKKMKLKTREYSLLHTFIPERREVLTPGQSLREVWGTDRLVILGEGN